MIEIINKIQDKTPIMVDLPLNVKLKIKIEDIKSDNSDSLLQTIHNVKCSYIETNNIKHLTNKMIKKYIEKTVKNFLKLLSVKGNFKFEIKILGYL